MITINLREETGSTIYDWRPELASIIATRLQERHPALRRRCGLENHARLREAVESLLAQLSRAMRLERPELFAYVVSDRDALSAIVSLSLVDGGTVLGQVRDTLQQYLPGPRGKLASEYIRFAQTRLHLPEPIAA